jgi:hypothetical protein
LKYQQSVEVHEGRIVLEVYAAVDDVFNMKIGEWVRYVRLHL